MELQSISKGCSVSKLKDDWTVSEMAENLCGCLQFGDETSEEKRK